MDIYLLGIFLQLADIKKDLRCLLAQVPIYYYKKHFNTHNLQL